MAAVYVAASKTVQDWAASVGLTKHAYKLGVTEDTAKAAVEALNAEAHGGAADWKLIGEQPADGVDEAQAIERLARKEKLIDPTYYPGLKGARGVFKVKISNAENHLVVKRALAGEEVIVKKLKPADIAAYLMHNALA